MKGTGFGAGILVGFIVAAALVYLYYTGALAGILGSITSNPLLPSTTTIATTTSIPANYLTNQTANASQMALDNYTLSLINQVRVSYGLQNVTLSSEPSGQQHSESMFNYGYFSHWDTYGLKPYMRYTLLGGKGAVDENVAYLSNESCGVLGCSGTINIESAIKNMEDSMLYNDSACCANGHRYNILDPNHNQISIGISYNRSTVYLVEDFIDNYTSWSTGSPSYSNGEVSLIGNIQGGYNLSQVIVSYDPPAQNMSIAQLAQTRSYGYGMQVAGVTGNPLEYYPNVTTIMANRYSVQGQSFGIGFNMTKLISQHGAGEYTIMLWLSNGGTGQNSTFIGSTYTLFINSSGGSYTPSSV
jgi:uncharacterized protein YkwD